MSDKTLSELLKEQKAKFVSVQKEGRWITHVKGLELNGDVAIGNDEVRANGKPIEKKVEKPKPKKRTTRRKK